jgi:hypothetical protein
LLGFDGEAGVDGANLKESLGGARRDFGDDDSGSEGGNGSTKPDEPRNTFAQNVANFFTPNDGKSYQGGELVDDEDDK